MKPIEFQLVAYTDPAGKWDINAPLEGNEDNLFIDVDLSNQLSGELILNRVLTLSEKGCLMVVADGMGGMNAGEVASGIAIKTVEQAFSPANMQKHTLQDSKQRAAYMEQVIIDADHNIKEHASNHPECSGMGSTLIMAWLQGNEATVSWIGDSRAYLYREGVGLKQISRDHSYVQELVDSGQLPAELAFDHPNGNIVTRSLGDNAKQAQPESITLSVGKGDIIMLNSDGLSGVLRDQEMEQIIQANQSSLAQCRIALWNAAKQADWYDNVTAILCQIVEGNDMNGGAINPQSFHTKGLGVFAQHTSLFILLITLFVLIIFAAGGWWYYRCAHNEVQLLPVDSTMTPVDTAVSQADTISIQQEPAHQKEYPKVIRKESTRPEEPKQNPEAEVENNEELTQEELTSINLTQE